MPETKGKKRTQEKTKDNRQMIIDAYKQHLLFEGKPPHSVFQFMHSLKMPEAPFYDHFASFKSLERSIWKDYLHRTIEAITSDKNYASFNSREKLLSFYYTLLEVLKTDRSFVTATLEMPSRNEITPSVLKEFREGFMEFVQEVINEGREADEIMDRKYLSDRYKDGLWLQTMFILNFWLKDDSAAFEKTDAAIEKAVNLSYDLMGAGPLDKMFDFAKFLYQNRF